MKRTCEICFYRFFSVSKKLEQFCPIINIDITKKCCKHFDSSIVINGEIHKFIDPLAVKAKK